ncbi:hypothetical protein [Pseudomonas aeruginosa]
MDLQKILGWKATEFQFTVTERNCRARSRVTSSVGK